MECPYCNANIKKAKFCPDCGKEIETGLSEEQKKYLTKKQRAHKVGAVAGSVVGGAGLGLGVIYFEASPLTGELVSQVFSRDGDRGMIKRAISF